MGRKLNLSHLSDDECRKILDVIQRDFRVRHDEKERFTFTTMFLKRVRLVLLLLILGLLVFEAVLLLIANGWTFSMQKVNSESKKSYAVETQDSSYILPMGKDKMKKDDTKVKSKGVEVTHEIAMRQRQQLGETSKTLGIKDEPAVVQVQAFEKESDITHSQKRCIKYLSIYTLHMGPFQAWREYAILNAAFREAKNLTSPYYDSRTIQNLTFSTMFIACPDFACDVVLLATADRHQLEQSDAIFVNFAPTMFRNKMHRISRQLIDDLPIHVRVFFYAMETPLMMNYWDKTIEDVQYHYDMTYHLGSDVRFPYGRYIPGEPTDIQMINYAENKTRLLVWVASNCNNTFWPRTEWVRNLEKLMVFDTYGKCGKKTCLPPMSPNCTKQLSIYKFNLALENAPCDEYISEKFWVNSLMNGLVPIVYGGRREAYERVAPPNSFIHVGDFSSQKKLVDYLNMVDRNDSLYNEFFAWRRQGRVEKIYPQLRPQSFCRVLPSLSQSTPTPVKRVGESSYFQSCQGSSRREFTMEGDITNWTPWR